MPALYFPDFPVLENAVKNADGTVTVDGDYIRRLAEYKIRINETEKTYSELKAMYNDETENTEKDTPERIKK